jgi:hypothetical protein
MAGYDLFWQGIQGRPNGRWVIDQTAGFVDELADVACLAPGAC